MFRSLSLEAKRRRCLGGELDCYKRSWASGIVFLYFGSYYGLFAGCRSSAHCTERQITAWASQAEVLLLASHQFLSETFEEHNRKLMAFAANIEAWRRKGECITRVEDIRLELLKRRDSRIGLNVALFAFGAVGSERSVPDLAKYAKGEKDCEIRADACFALGGDRVAEGCSWPARDSFSAIEIIELGWRPLGHLQRYRAGRR